MSSVNRAGNAPDLSVVIPYFNQPEELDVALADLTAQRGLCLEAIVVDDASDKSCAHVVEKYRNMGLDVTLLRQEKRSYTLKGRLTGMQRATGRWLAFMDADDGLVSETAYARAVAEADAAGTDILHFRVTAIDREGFSSHWPYAAPFYQGRLEGSEIFTKWLDASCPAHSVWNKIYSRELYAKILSLRHNIRIFRIEDFYLSAHFLFFAREYVSSDLMVYSYRLPGGTHLEKAAGRAFDALRMFTLFPARFGKFGLPGEQCKQLRKYLRILVTLDGGRMCRMFPDDIWLEKPFRLDFEAAAMRMVLRYGGKMDLFWILVITNAVNARKLGRMNGIINA